MANKFRDFLARFLYGRYGTDQLYTALFITEIILLVLGSVLNVLGQVEPVLSVISIVLYVLALAVIVWSMFRFFSRKIDARRRENEAWLRFLGKFKRKPKPKLPPDTAEHIFRMCPKCRSVLRLPHKPGRHKVKCPRCDKRFGVKVK